MLPVYNMLMHPHLIKYPITTLNLSILEGQAPTHPAIYLLVSWNPSPPKLEGNQNSLTRSVPTEFAPHLLFLSKQVIFRPEVFPCAPNGPHTGSVNSHITGSINSHIMGRVRSLLDIHCKPQPIRLSFS